MQKQKNCTKIELFKYNVKEVIYFTNQGQTFCLPENLVIFPGMLSNKEKLVTAQFFFFLSFTAFGDF